MKMPLFVRSLTNPDHMTRPSKIDLANQPEIYPMDKPKDGVWKKVANPWFTGKKSAPVTTTQQAAPVTPPAKPSAAPTQKKEQVTVVPSTTIATPKVESKAPKPPTKMTTPTPTFSEKDQFLRSHGDDPLLHQVCHIQGVEAAKQTQKDLDYGRSFSDRIHSYSQSGDYDRMFAEFESSGL